MSNDTSDRDLLSTDALAFKFENIGDTCKGRVVSAVTRQQTDIDTGEKKFFPSGDPIMQIVMTIDQDNGNGETTVYFKGGNYEPVEGKGQSALEALKAAAAGMKQQELPGGTIAIQYSGIGKKTKAAYSAPKLYTVQYRPPAITIPDDTSLI